MGSLFILYKILTIIPFYSDNQKTMEWENDIIAIFEYIWYCYKANSFIRRLLNHLFSEMGVFTLHNCCVSYSMDFF